MIARNTVRIVLRSATHNVSIDFGVSGLDIEKHFIHCDLYKVLKQFDPCQYLAQRTRGLPRVEDCDRIGVAAIEGALRELYSDTEVFPTIDFAKVVKVEKRPNCSSTNFKLYSGFLVDSKD